MPAKLRKRSSEYCFPIGRKVKAAYISGSPTWGGKVQHLLVLWLDVRYARGVDLRFTSSSGKGRPSKRRIKLAARKAGILV